MNQQTYDAIEAYMLTCMQDSAHDKDHVYRVLNYAMTIAAGETGVDMQILIAACLLHDVGRPEQMADHRLCHAQVGGDKAWRFLIGLGWSEERAEAVRKCIRSHRFRKSEPPETIEAKILYDADKLDVAGAIGLARTWGSNGAVNQPIYSTAADGTILDGRGGEPDSFLREYRYKLEGIYDRFLTKTGSRMAAQRRQAAVDFCDRLWEEVHGTLQAGGRYCRRRSLKTTERSCHGST